MDIRGNRWLVEECRIQELNRVPGWARAEHMEMNVPLKELWNYTESSTRKRSIFARLTHTNDR